MMILERRTRKGQHERSTFMRTIFVDGKMIESNKIWTQRKDHKKEENVGQLDKKTLVQAQKGELATSQGSGALKGSSEKETIFSTAPSEIRCRLLLREIKQNR